MQAIVYHRYGSPDVLQLEEIERPTPGETEVLIKVHAASVNPLDWHLLRGMPYGFRMMSGLRKPKEERLGIDGSGQVEAVGSKATQFKPGDAVFGACRGAFAEYACAPQSAVVLKPANIDFWQAASAPVAALTALQALRDKGHLEPGQKVLINGAAGGVGTFAVQIARHLGGDVTGVCSTRNVDLMRSLGAHHVIDYTQEDFTKSGQRCDLFIDCIGNHSLPACRRVLAPKGVYIMVGGQSGRWVSPMDRWIRARLLSPFVPQNLITMVAKVNQQGLNLIAELMASGKVTPIIDRTYSLRDVPAAIRYIEEGHARGKVVIAMNESR
ncbi:MAG TPA: NAD(P)-dependent alcohol dehydrogenase [Acidobacteriaceae bacterium]|nr:NAD(P)-dependent alcohol dehydrogenase [Acidobacteriaceae bacterium]